jgi:hypothetical protein
MLFVVITKAPELPMENYYDDILIPREHVIGWQNGKELKEIVLTQWDQQAPTDEEIKRGTRVKLMPLRVGEVLVLDGHNGREMCGRRRKPSKWFVEFETFSNLDDAIRRAKEVSPEVT